MEDNDLPYVLDSRISKIYVRSDCSYDEVDESTYTILKDDGRSFAASYYETYNTGITEYKLLEAKTIVGGVEYPVDKTFIEDKAVVDQGASVAFDDVHKLTISFQKPEIGTRIYRKALMKNKPLMRDKYLKGVLGFSGAPKINNSEVEIKSEIPLEIYVNDPTNALSVKKSQDGKLYVIRISQTKPVYEAHTNEYVDSWWWLNPAKRTYIAFTNIKSWKEYGDAWAKSYYDVLNQELPQLYSDIMKKAKDIKDEVKQINTVIAEIIDSVQYMGDWRTIKGALVPHDLAFVAENKIGDCKDFSSATSAILKRLGYAVYPAIVLRGSEERGLSYGEKAIEDINHAILKAVSASGKVYWLDPTNQTAMAQGIYPDIAGKNAIVLDLENTHIERIPDVDANSARLVVREEIKLLEDNVTQNNLSVDLYGLAAEYYTGLSLRFAKDEIVDTFYNITGHSVDIEHRIKVEVPDLSSRIVKDIHFSSMYQSTDTENLVRTNFGTGVLLSKVKAFEYIQENQVYDLYIGIPGVVSRVLVVKGKKVSDAHHLKYNVDNEYFSIARDYSYDGKDTTINTTVVTKKSFIPNEFLHTEEYIAITRYWLMNEVVTFE